MIKKITHLKGLEIRKRQEPRSRFTPQPIVGLRLEERDEQLLCDIYMHRFMTRGQLETLYFTSTVRCNARLRQLFDYGFVKRYYLPAAPFGAQAIYSIGKNAMSLVASRLEVEADEVARQQRGTRTPSFIEHTLAVVDVRLIFQESCVNNSEVNIERWLPEMLCRHQYEIEVNRSGHKRKEAFKPDAFIRLSSHGKFHHFFIEIDLGHTSSRQFLSKLSIHQQYLESGLFQKIYGSDTFSTLVITTGNRRLSNLTTLVEKQGSQLFVFTTFEQLSQQGPLDSIWQQGTNKTRSILESST